MTNPTTITTTPGVPYVDVERLVDAPVEAVYRAYTDADLLPHWLGPIGYEMDLTEFDPRTGGSWAYTHIAPDGGVYGFRGVFHSVEPKRIVQTFEYAGTPGHVTLDEVVFEDVDGSTLIRTHTSFMSVEDRDGMVASGMAMGVTQGFERMDALLAS